MVRAAAASAAALLLVLAGLAPVGGLQWAAPVARMRLSRRHMCTDKEFKPLERKPGDVKQDADPSWRTADVGKIVPVPKDRVFAQRPELITFNAFNTLIQPSQSIGKWYREALNEVCDMTIRLPRPAHFTEAFNAAYAEVSKAHPCFGSTTGLTSKQWWYEVVSKTYKTTKDLNQIEPDELEKLLPAVFSMLYVDVFGTKEGWAVKEDVVYTLQKLAEWRDQGAGPKIGIVSNFDDRLPKIMDGVFDRPDIVLIRLLTLTPTLSTNQRLPQPPTPTRQNWVSRKASTLS